MATLPIDQVKKEILASLAENQLTIIETPTGSGKTMRLPFWAWQLSGKKVHCLVPRVVMAKEAAKGAVITTWGDSSKVGFATGRGDGYGKDVKLIYMTEGSFIQRSIAEKLPKGSYVLIDEVHEQGSMTEALLVQAKEWIVMGLKVVLMSATLDVSKYRLFYTNDGISVGVVSLPPKERPFQLDIQTVDKPLQSIAQAAANGARCLVGVEGKVTLDNYMSELKAELKRLGANVPVFPFHGELEQEDQDFPLKHKGAMIVVATNVLQSGVTIQGLSHGYFNGIGNRIEVSNGKRALKQYQLSKAEMTQWFGRIGRTCKGIIFQDVAQATAFGQRDAMPTAEILRAPLEETLLMFQSIGLNIKTERVLNQPPTSNILSAEKILIQLGCLDSNGVLTELGRSVFYQGVGLRGGLIQILGEEFGIANTARKIAALLSSSHPFRKVQYSKYRKVIEGLDYSDHMAWVAIINDICNRYGNRVSGLDMELFKMEMEDTGVFRKNLMPIMKNFGYIDQDWVDFVTSPAEVKQAIQRIFKAAFADCLISKEYGSWKTPEGLYPKMADCTQINEVKAETIIGEINIIPTRRGSLTLLEGVTVVEEIQPKDRITEATFDYTTKEVVQFKETTLGGTVISKEKLEIQFSEDIAKVLFTNIGYITEFSDIHAENKAIANKINSLSKISGGLVDSFDYSKWLLNKLIEVQAIGRTEIICDLEDLTLNMSDFFSLEDIYAIEAENPIELDGQAIRYEKNSDGYYVEIQLNDNISLEVIETLPTEWVDGRKVVYKFNNYSYNSIEDVKNRFNRNLNDAFERLQYDKQTFNEGDKIVLAKPKIWDGGVAFQGLVVYSEYSCTLQTKWFKTQLEAIESIEVVEAFIIEYKKAAKADALRDFNRRYEDDIFYSIDGLDMSIEEIEYNGYKLFVGYVVSKNALDVCYIKQAAFTKEEIEANRDTSKNLKFRSLLDEISNFRYTEDFQDVERFAQNNRKGRLMSEIQSYLDRAANEAYEMSKYAIELFEKAKELFAAIEAEYTADKVANNPFAAAFAKLKK